MASVPSEAVAETNVPRESLGEPELMGFMADSTGKPDVLFLLRAWDVLGVWDRSSPKPLTCLALRNGLYL